MLWVSMSFAYVFVLLLYAARELAHLSSIARHLKTYANEVSAVAQAFKTCAAHVAHVAHH